MTNQRFGPRGNTSIFSFTVWDPENYSTIAHKRYKDYFSLNVFERNGITSCFILFLSENILPRPLLIGKAVSRRHCINLIAKFEIRVSAL